MKLFTRIKLLFIILYATGASAQDMHFTQFYSSPLYLNPAFAGADVCSRVSLTYRNQWPGIKKTYTSYLASVDHYFNQKNIGAGILFASDVAGTGNLKTTIVNAQIAYEARLTKKVYLRLGAQPGVQIRSINFNNLIFGDQIARGGEVASLEEPTLTRAFFDIGAGALVYTRRYWAGFSAYHLNRPNQSMREDPDGLLPIKISIHGGGKFQVKSKEDEKDEAKKKYVSPAFNYRHQNKFDQLDLGFYYSQSVLNLGLWYRGIPLFKAYSPGYKNNDAVAIIVGLKTDRFNFGYSYDITISKLARLSYGAHEVAVSYQLCKLKKKKKYRMLTPCPKF
jgi:type IX secretion system PorP/SprF family membrane protein